MDRLAPIPSRDIVVVLPRATALPVLIARSVAGHRGTRALLLATALAVAAVLVRRGVAEAHATLVSSEPASGSALPAAPTRVRLVFSERVEWRLSTISLVGADGHATALAVQRDSTDARAVVAGVASLRPGQYRVDWRVVAADGHASRGSFPFSIAIPARADTGPGAAPAAAPVSAPSSVTAAPGTPAPRELGPTVAGAPLLLSIARGLGVGALMGLAGILLFMRWNDPRARRPLLLARWLALAAVLLLGTHLLLWLAHTSPSGQLDRAWMADAFDTPTGSRELWRTGLALFAFVAVVLSRRPTIALLLAAAALVLSGGIGHPAAIHPFVAVPAKMVHLLAAALWFGGLLWLVVRERDDAVRYRLEALRVSTAALAGVIVVALSGIVQTVLFLEAPLDLVRSAYGQVALLKVAGLLALMAFGAYHRYRVLPRLHASADARRLGRSATRESLVFLVVVLLGGLLANIPPPQREPATRPAASAAASTTE